MHGDTFTVELDKPFHNRRRCCADVFAYQWRCYNTSVRISLPRYRVQRHVACSPAEACWYRRIKSNFRSESRRRATGTVAFCGAAAGNVYRRWFRIDIDVIAIHRSISAQFVQRLTLMMRTFSHYQWLSGFGDFRAETSLEPTRVVMLLSRTACLGITERNAVRPPGSEFFSMRQVANGRQGNQSSKTSCFEGIVLTNMFIYLISAPLLMTEVVNKDHLH